MTVSLKSLKPVARIDWGLGNEVEGANQSKELLITDFRSGRGRIRRSGIGYITEINDHLFEGRCPPTWPDGKRHDKNVYAQTKAEREEKLEALIREMVGHR